MLLLEYIFPRQFNVLLILLSTCTLTLRYIAVLCFLFVSLPVPAVGDRNVIQELVRVFELKRLATFELQAARRHQIQRQTVDDDDDDIERAAVHRLTHDFNSIAATRFNGGPTIDETQFRDVEHLQKYLRCEYMFWIIVHV